MNIAFTTSAKLDKAISHLLAYDRLHGANENITPQQYLEAELAGKLAELEEKAEKVRKLYVDETTKQLDATKMADLAAYIYGLLNE